MPRSPGAWILAVIIPSLLAAADGDRLAYLDGPLDPYYPHRDFPKLITPQWVGDAGVECVVTLAIDDMRESGKYEAFLRPILNRLKAIDGRAAVSIMSCRVQPDDPQLQAWLKEGLSFEVHTYDHPCPCLQDGGLVKAKETYDKCVDLMNQIPGNKPVAFRMPCCDSKNTPSPRFWAEVFNKTTAKGNFLQIDSSVFNIITNKDKELPKEITELPDGSERFRRYVPFQNFVNTIEDYPYPYIIGGMCWEFPCVAPSDWSAQHVQKPNNPDTVRDWKLALDACVIKKGTFNLVFHPHGWIKAEQIVELIDHAVQKHGKKVKFLTFKECAERLSRNLLSGSSLRASDGSRVRIDVLEQNGDGFLDVVFPPQDRSILARLWQANSKSWRDLEDHSFRNHRLADYYHRATKLLVDIDGDGVDEAVWPGEDNSTRVGAWELANVPMYYPLKFTLPTGAKFSLIDTGLRFIDVNSDGKLDLVFSNHERYCLYLFKDMKEGWSTKVFDVVRGKEDGSAPAIPPFVRADGTNNGAWFHSGALWLMNEDTWRLPDGVFKLTFADMLAKRAGGGEGDRGGEGDGAAVRGPGSNDGAAKTTNAKSTKYLVLSTTQPTNSDKPNPQSAIRNPQSPPRPLAPSPPPNFNPQSPTRTSDARYDDLKAPPPLSPEESLKALHVRPGMQVELVAAEPLIVDPVAFDWGPDGRLWVVEMRDYPSGITWHKEGDEEGKPGGRVKVLTDTDGDGRYDKAALFLDEVPFPTGIKIWRKGILVTAAPDILYAEDKDGDDRADERIVLYRGFGEGNQQHRVNGLRWGLDNWLHVGNGDSGGVIRSLAALSSAHALREQPKSNTALGAGHVSRSETATREVNVSGHDLRIRPDTGELDATSGNTQFGRERDDWGNWFGNNNSNPLWHYTLDDHYLRRNKHFTPPPIKKQVSVNPGAAPVYPMSKTLTRFNDENKANRFTSACGPTLYRDDLLGSEYYGNSFVCEPVHNLVHREILEPVGATFTSKRADDEQTSEFLASADSWFRPSMCRTGPDGALWVSDMYRFVIEHPKWIPPAAQAKLDLRAGDDKGRIYRIYPTGTRPRPVRRLDQLETAGLVAALDSPNGTQRDLVHQMLLWRNDKGASELLRSLATSAEQPQVRLQALSILDGLGDVQDKDLTRAMADPHAAVRRHGVRLSESRLAAGSLEFLAYVQRIDDRDPQVKMQVAYSLGECSEPLAANRLAEILNDQAADYYITAAAFSSVNERNLNQVLNAAVRWKPSAPATEKLLAFAASTGTEEALNIAVGAAMQRDREGGFSRTRLVAVSEALARRKIKLRSLLGEGSKTALDKMLAEARERAAADGSSAPSVIAAISMLGRGFDDHDAADRDLLTRLLSPQKSPEIRAAAIAALVRNGGSELPNRLLADWPSQTPALRNQILDALGAREDWSLALLDAVASGQAPAAQFDARRRQQFLMARSNAVREKAEKVLAGAIDANRQKLVEAYLTATGGNPGDATRGKAAFAKRCANCHRLEGAGHAVGPDLSPLTHKPVDYLLTAILDPNRAVEDRYVEYVAQTADGRQLSGILVEETGASLTLAAPEGKQFVLPRGELEQLKSSGKSLMPEGVERDVTPAEMVDLLAYLKRAAPAPKQLALNQPEVVQPFNDGSLRLFASNCRAYGPTIKMEETYLALGWWSSQEDHCVWSFDVPPGGGGNFRVTLEYSCDSKSAGNTVVVEANGQTLTGTVASSGGWDKYRGWQLGTLKLAEGRGELLVRSSGPIKGALFDLGEVRLVPQR